MPIATRAQKRAGQAPPPKVSLTVDELLVLRANPTLRDAFLKRCARACRPQIAYIVMSAIGRDNGIIDGEARQSFMVAASAAIDSAITVDDGRGKNDPAKWIQFRALNAVRDLIRDIHCRRAGKPSPRQQFERNLVYQSDLEADDNGRVKHGLTGDQSTFDHVLAHRGHYRAESTEDEAIVDILLDELMGALTSDERHVAELLITGRYSTGEVTLKCVCKPGSGHHCVTNDIAHATGINEQTVRRIVKRIQAKTARVFEVVA